MQGLRYQPFYCEENIWHLCREPRVAGGDKRVLFISNYSRCVALWNARMAAPREAIFWDYHVVMLAREVNWQVWDLDTRLPMPCQAEDYFAATFDACPQSYRPLFRLLDAQHYLDCFTSDRRHMKHADGSFRAPPPQWPPLSDGAHNLDRFIDMSDGFLGQSLDLQGLYAELGLVQSRRSSKNSSTADVGRER